MKDASSVKMGARERSGRVKGCKREASWCRAVAHLSPSFVVFSFGGALASAPFFFFLAGPLLWPPWLPGHIFEFRVPTSPPFFFF